MCQGLEICDSDHGCILDRAGIESVLRKFGVSLPLPECSSQGTDSPGMLTSCCGDTTVAARPDLTSQREDTAGSDILIVKQPLCTTHIHLDNLLDTVSGHQETEAAVLRSREVSSN